MSAVDFIVTLFLLIVLQAVLGFDNLLYISLESKRVPKEKQAFVRRTGIALAIGLRIVLLFVVVNLVSGFSEPWFTISMGAEITPEAHHTGEVTTVRNIVDGSFNLHVLIVLFGGVFIVYTAGHSVALDYHEWPAGVGVTAAGDWVVGSINSTAIRELGIREFLTGFSWMVFGGMNVADPGNFSAPRTMLGVDRAGRLLSLEVDGCEGCRWGLTETQGADLLIR